MQPYRDAEEPNSVGIPRGAMTSTQVIPSEPPRQDHPSDVTVTTGSQSEATSIERTSFDAGIGVAFAPSDVPGPPRGGPLVGGIDSERNHGPDAVDGASPSQLELAESSAIAVDGAAERSVLSAVTDDGAVSPQPRHSLSRSRSLTVSPQPW